MYTAGKRAMVSINRLNLRRTNFDVGKNQDQGFFSLFLSPSGDVRLWFQGQTRPDLSNNQRLKGHSVAEESVCDFSLLRGSSARFVFPSDSPIPFPSDNDSLLRFTLTFDPLLFILSFSTFLFLPCVFFTIRPSLPSSIVPSPLKGESRLCLYREPL